MTTTDRQQPAPSQDLRPWWSRRTRRIVTVAVLLALAAGGMLGVRHWDARTAAALADALAALETAGEELAASVDAGEAALADSADRVTDERVRTTLAEALTAAALDLAVPPGSRAEQTAQATDLSAAAREHAGRVGAAAAAVLADVEAWRLARAVEAYDAAVADLTAATTAGEELLATTEGQVLPDNAVREALRDALDAAVAVRDGVVEPDDLTAVSDAAAEAAAAGDVLAGAVAAVTEAHEAWQVAEAERAAAEAAARAAASASSSAGARRSPGSSSGGTSGGTSQAPAGGSTGSTGGDGYWVDEGYVLGPDLCVGGDELGNSWAC